MLPRPRHGVDVDQVVWDRKRRERFLEWDQERVGFDLPSRPTKQIEIRRL